MLGATTAAAGGRDVTFEQLLSQFQLGVAKATGAVMSKLSYGDRWLSGAQEWATNLNNYAASVVQTLTKKTQSGQLFYVAFPDKAAALLGQAAKWAAEESGKFEAARAQLLEVSRVPDQAASLLAKKAGEYAAKAGAAAAEGAAKAVEDAFRRAKEEGISSLLYMFLGLGLFGLIIYIALRR